MAIKWHIYIGGFKGAGKSYAAEKLAERFGVKRVDLDHLLEEKHQMPVRELYRMLGDLEFRKREFDILKELDLDQRQIISLGGGTLMYPLSSQLVQKRGVLLGIRYPLHRLEKELLSKKPLPAILDPLNPSQSLKKLYKERQDHFKKLEMVFFLRNQIQSMETYVRQHIWQDF